MGTCQSQIKNNEQKEIQSIIFLRNKVYKKEIVIWTEARARAWMNQRQWLILEPPDTSKSSEIRMHIIDTNEFESLEFHEIGSGIKIVYGMRAPPEPKRRYIHVPSNVRKKINTLDDIKD